MACCVLRKPGRLTINVAFSQGTCSTIHLPVASESVKKVSPAAVMLMWRALDRCAVGGIYNGSIDSALGERYRADEQQQSECTHTGSASSVALWKQQRDGVRNHTNGAREQANGLAIGLNVNGGIGNRGERGAVGADDCDAADVAEAIEDHAAEKRQVGDPAMAFVDYDFESLSVRRTFFAISKSPP